MILKGSQRGGGQNLAAHLMNLHDNEHVSLHALRGFAGETLGEALKEAEAVARGTKCRQYLFSLSLSPPESVRVPVEDFEAAIERAEERLGLQDQPRAILFHEKEGRRHAHCVWSRIDAQTMTARQMSFFKTRLTSLSRELYLEHGWAMPRGLIEAGARDPANFTLAEWQRAKRAGQDPRWIRAVVQDCWSRADGAAAFTRALEDRGFRLARGDRRGHVILDHTGEAHSLPRCLALKTKDVRARLGEAADLPDVARTREEIAARMTPAIHGHIEESRARFRQRSQTLAGYKTRMTHLHREARAKLDERQRREWDEETRQRAARLPKGIRGLWHRLTGRYQEARKANEEEAGRSRARQSRERQELIDKHLDQRAVLQKQFKELRLSQAEQLLELRRDMGRFLSFTRAATGRGASRGGLGLRLER